jgi:peptide/nickel transport system permease protein
MSEFFSPGPVRDALTSSVIALTVLLLAVIAIIKVRKDEPLAAGFAEVYRRRRFSIAVLVLYCFVALLDSIAWVGGGSVSEGDLVSAHEARSVIDRVFSRPRERGYSAPLADKEFYEGSPLAARHVLGTNVLGEDVLYLTLKGARVALLIGALTSLITIPLALFFGVLAGYFGGRLDDIIFFIMSTLASMPGVLLLVALVMALGQGTLSVCIALGVTSWVGFARLTRGETMKLRQVDYVLAARSLGVRPARIILRHIIPNLLHLIVITFVLLFSGLVLSEATLSWLGIGVGGSWGQMIAQAKDELSRDPLIWWNVVPAGVALFALLLCLNLVGDALRDVLDPRTRRLRA